MDDTGTSASGIPGLRGRYLWLDGGRVHVHHTEPKGPPVLLLSGAGVDNALLSWRHLIPALAPQHHVLALDWPKQGLSRPWFENVTHERMLRCVIEVLDAFEVGRAHVVGLSQGGALALAAGAKHPDRVHRLVALAPAGTISFPPVLHQLLWLTARSRLLNATIPTALFRRRRNVERLVRRTLFAGPVEDFEAVVDEILQEARRSGARSSDWQNDSIGFLRMRVDLREELPRIMAPTLFIQGDRDVGVRASHTIAAAGRVPNARLEILEGVGHWVSRQSPERVNRLVAEFLAEQRACM